jgi:hypothetical protein
MDSEFKEFRALLNRHGNKNDRAFLLEEGDEDLGVEHITQTNDYAVVKFKNTFVRVEVSYDNNGVHVGESFECKPVVYEQTLYKII